MIHGRSTKNHSTKILLRALMNVEGMAIFHFQQSYIQSLLEDIPLVFSLAVVYYWSSGVLFPQTMAIQRRSHATFSSPRSSSSHHLRAITTTTTTTTDTDTTTPPTTVLWKQQPRSRPALGMISSIVVVVVVLTGFGTIMWKLLEASCGHSYCSSNNNNSMEQVLLVRQAAAQQHQSKSTVTTKSNNNHHPTPSALVAGVARSTWEIEDTTWKTLQELACQYNIPIHILVAKHNYNRTIHDHSTNKYCAPVWVELQDTILPHNQSLSEKRVVRLAQIRDAHRQRMRQLFFTKQAEEEQQLEHDNNNTTQQQQHPLFFDISSTSIILMDLDLEAIPSTAEILQRIRLQQESNSQPHHHDVICSAGNYLWKSQKLHKLFYYDSFATIVYPDTFVYPLEWRLIPQYYTQEDPSNVIVNDNHAQPGNLTEVSFMKKIQREARRDPDGLVPMRSCFVSNKDNDDNHTTTLMMTRVEDPCSSFFVLSGRSGLLQGRDLAQPAVSVHAAGKCPTGI